MAGFNTKSPTIRRIMKEAQELSTSPSPDYHAAPLESNLFEWHFTIRGPPTSAFANGLYHGRIVLPPTYPLRPPSFRFLTPSGRFEVNREICLSISGFHEESWQPAWGLRTALVALRSFMETDAKGQVGGVEASKAIREKFANESRSWKCSGCGGRSNADIIQEVEEAAKEAGEAKAEEKVPEELRLGYKDELDSKKRGFGADEPDEDEDEDEEPFMLGRATTARAAAADAPATSPLPIGGPVAAPASAPVPTPTPTTATTPRAPPVAPLVVATQTQAHPEWVDKAIVGVAIALAFMLLKKFLAAS